MLFCIFKHRNFHHTAFKSLRLRLLPQWGVPCALVQPVAGHVKAGRKDEIFLGDTWLSLQHQTKTMDSKELEFEVVSNWENEKSGVLLPARKKARLSGRDVTLF